MKPYQVIRWLNESPGRLDKEKIIRDAWDAECYEFFLGAKLAYDKLVTFGVKQVPTRPSTMDLWTSQAGWTEFYNLANQLISRELTGNNMRLGIEDFMRFSDFNNWNEWYRLILLKDFKCGVSEKTINKVLKETGSELAKNFMIPVFACKLAHPGEKHPKKLVGLKFLDVKLDGVRILAVCNKDKGTVTLHTRNGKINTNFPHIEDRLRDALPDLPYSLVLDGEMISATFQTLMTQFNRKDDVDTGNAKYALFDVIPLSDFRKGKCPEEQKFRDTRLQALTLKHAEVFGDFIYSIPKSLIDLDTETELFNRFNKDAIAAGYEGIMVKDPSAPYECKRSHAWLKLKPVITVDLTVIGTERGAPETKLENTLGVLCCEGTDGGKKIEVNVGSGLSEEQRDEFWANRDKLVGHTVEIKADAVTENQDGTYSLRFPRFIRFRGVEPGEKF